MSQTTTTNSPTSSDWSFGEAIAALFFVCVGALILYFAAVAPIFETGVELFEGIILGPYPFSALGWGNFLWNMLWGGVAGFLIGLIRRRWKSRVIAEMVNIAASPKMISAVKVGKWCVAVHILVGVMSSAIVGLLGLVSPLHLLSNSTDVLRDPSIPAVAMLTGAGLFNAGGTPPGGPDLALTLISIALLILILTIIVSSITIPILSIVVNGLASGSARGVGKSLGGSALVAITGVLTRDRLQPFTHISSEPVKGLSPFRERGRRASLATGLISGMWTGVINSLVVILCLYIARSGVVESLGHLPGLEEIGSLGNYESLDGETVALRPGNHVIIVGASDSTVALNFKTGEKLWHSWRGAKSLALSLNGRTLAVVDSNGESLKMDPANGTDTKLQEGDSLVDSTCLLNGRAVIIRKTDRGALVWDVARNSRSLTLRGSISTQPGCASRAAIVAAGSDNIVILWGANSADPVRTIIRRSIWDDKVGPVAVSPNGASVAAVYSGFGNPRIRLWDAASGKLLRTLASPTSVVKSVAFSPDGKLLASGGTNGASDRQWVGEVTLWDASAGRGLKFVKVAAAGEYSSVESVIFSPSGELLASTGTHATKVWAVR